MDSTSRTGVRGLPGVTRRGAFGGPLAGSALLALACGGPPSGGGGGDLPRPAAGPVELRVATNTSIQNMPGWENAARGYEAKYPTRKVVLEHGTGNACTDQSGAAGVTA